jgi:Fe-S-cluster containining protein
MNETLAAYRGLLRKVDDFFERVRGAHPGSFSCRLGCHSCCRPGLSVGAAEAENIREGLRADPEREASLRALASADPHRGLRCSFLGEGGACGIYELRPLVCRSHGLPLEFKDFAEESGEEAVFRDACPLNFIGQDLASLPNEDVLNLDTLNTILATLNRLVDPAGRRIPLELEALLGSRGHVDNT